MINLLMICIGVIDVLLVKKTYDKFEKIEIDTVSMYDRTLENEPHKRRQIMKEYNDEIGELRRNCNIKIVATTLVSVVSLIFIALTCA